MAHVHLSELIDGLSDWNGGKGVSPEGWLSATGNFQLACGYTLVFWPQFVEYDGMILREGFDRESLEGFLSSYGEDKSKVEWVMNHLHLVDIHYVGSPDASLERILFIGRVLKEIYECKLANDFPSKDIVVELVGGEDEDLFNHQLSFFVKRDA
jgi:hypothetical protein